MEWPGMDCNIITFLYGPTFCKASVVSVQISDQISEVPLLFSAMERGIKCRPWISWYDSCCALGSLCTLLGQ